MTNLLRSSKSASDWMENDLLAYNINVRIVPEKEFFGEKVQRLPEGLGKEFLEYEFGKDPLPDDSDKLLEYLDMASRALRGQESMVDDFAFKLLERTGFDKGSRLLRTRHNIPFIVSGEYRNAQTDVCIVSRRKHLLLLVQEDKRMTSAKDPEPQVIAEAIAAFQENNKIRKDYGLDPFNEMKIPCITMVGTFPRFYLVPVTIELSNCVKTSQYPVNPVTVHLFVPNVSRRMSDGMKPKDDRLRILQYYEGFKKFVDMLEELLK
jgi:hypothetical protein